MSHWQPNGIIRLQPLLNHNLNPGPNFEVHLSSIISKNNKILKKLFDTLVILLFLSIAVKLYVNSLSYERHKPTDKVAESYWMMQFVANVNYNRVSRPDVPIPELAKLIQLTFGPNYHHEMDLRLIPKSQQKEMLSGVDYYVYSEKYSFGVLANGAHFPGSFNAEVLQKAIRKPHVWYP